MWGVNSALSIDSHPIQRRLFLLFCFAVEFFSCVASNEIKRALLEGMLFRFAAGTDNPILLVT